MWFGCSGMILDVTPGISSDWPTDGDGSLFASPGWLRAMTGRLGEPPLTLTVRENGRAILAVHATVRTRPRPTEFFDPRHVLIDEAPALPLTDASRVARAELARTAPAPERWTPSLVVMLPGYECVPVGPGRDDPRAIEALVTGTRDWAAANGVPTIAYLYVRPEAAALAAAVEDHGYARIPLTLTWDLPVPADGRAGYLAALPRRRRQNATREMLRLADAGVTVRLLDDAETRTEAIFARLVDLRCRLVRKYRGTADETAERVRLASLVGDVALDHPTVIVATTGDTIVGFALFAAWGRQWQCLSTGYDYTDPRSRLAYFSTAYYAAVPAAAAAGARSIGYGQGSSTAKRARGCAGTPLVGWARSEDPELAAALRSSAAVTALEQVA